MKPKTRRNWAFSTKGVRTGTSRTEHGEHSDAIFLTSSFQFDSAEQAARRFDNQEEGFIYSRFSNPTVAAFQTRLAALEGAEECLATSSGMSAIMACLMGICSAGSRVVASSQLFGASITLMDQFISKFGISIDYVHTNDILDWERMLGSPADLVLIETPSNPTLRVFDISALSRICKRNNTLLAVDNCFCTPYFQRPLQYGADLIIHSATKYIDGQGRVLGGAVLGSKDLVDRIFPFLRAGGPALSPFNAWILFKSLETLSVRMEVHQRSAQKIANYLETHPKIRNVYFTGLPSHPDYQLACRQQTGHAGIISIVLKDCNRKAVYEFINRVRLFSITANFGDARSTITHPHSTTHLRVSEQIKQKTRLEKSLVRISIGLEDTDDLIDDLQQALETVTKKRRL